MTFTSAARRSETVGEKEPQRGCRTRKLTPARSARNPTPELQRNHPPSHVNEIARGPERVSRKEATADRLVQICRLDHRDVARGMRTFVGQA